MNRFNERRSSCTHLQNDGGYESHNYCEGGGYFKCDVCKRYIDKRKPKPLKVMKKPIKYRDKEMREMIKEFIRDLDPECDHRLIEKWSGRLNE